MTDGAFHLLTIVGIAIAKTRHELVVRLGFAAVPVTGPRQRRSKAALKRLDCAAADFILNVEYIFQSKVVFLGERDRLSLGVEELHRHSPLRAELLDISLQGVADSE